MQDILRVLLVIVALFAFATLYIHSHDLFDEDHASVPHRFGNGPGLAPKAPQGTFRLIMADGTVERIQVVTNHDVVTDPSGPSRLHGAGFGYFRDGSLGWTTKDYVSLAEETIEQKKRAHSPNCFNLPRSDSLPLHRQVPDVRSRVCKDRHYPENLPGVSVVFVFFNEPLSPLLRSITSVLDRTPPKLLHEIILVDDGSDAPWTKDLLEEYLQLLPKITLRRMPIRQGLMATRAEGARISSSEITVFLDSHIEVNHGWLEPLVYRIVQNRQNVVMPIIDSIHPDTFEYVAGGLDLVTFNWMLNQQGSNRKRSDSEPMASPAMAGGLFAINTSLFHDLGGYDPEMKYYGGEEMEISLRLWMCGSRLECIPCSHVGHIFRTGEFHQGQAYPVPWESTIKNKLRAARMWMSPQFYELVRRNNRALPSDYSLGGFSWSDEIKDRLKCKAFDWYLDNVFPEMFVPGDERHRLAEGSIRNPAFNLCLDTLDAVQDGQLIGTKKCTNSESQGFIITSAEEIRVGSGAFNYCLDRGNAEGISLYNCHGGGGNQRFVYNKANGQLYEPRSQQCLEVLQDGKLKSSHCDGSSKNQGQSWTIDEKSLFT